MCSTPSALVAAISGSVAFFFCVSLYSIAPSIALTASSPAPFAIKRFFFASEPSGANAAATLRPATQHSDAPSHLGFI
jgi:hypothetical protein|eukprot:31252-Pelagococcus_subviridis.AAC.5